MVAYFSDLYFSINENVFSLNAKPIAPLCCNYAKPIVDCQILGPSQYNNTGNPNCGKEMSMVFIEGFYLQRRLS
jgi:hypothetical protein